MRDRLRVRLGSIRFRITALATLAVGAVLGLAGFSLVLLQGMQLQANLDRGLTARADDFTRAHSLTDAVDLDALVGVGNEDRAVQLVSPDGSVLAVSSTWSAVPALPVLAGTDDRFWTTDLPAVEDDSYRVLSRRLADGVTLHVAENADDVEDALGDLRLALVLVVPGVTAALAGLVWMLVGRTLRPVEAIRAEVASIQDTPVDHRVPIPSGDDEVARLAKTMNEMLARLESAGTRQRRFVADASHELRSPLTRLRTRIEVDLAQQDAGSVPDWQETHSDILEEAIGLQRLVDDLLHLARSDDPGTGLRVLPVDLDDLVLGEVRRARDLGRIEIDIRTVSGAHLVGDADALARMVRNLLDNGRRHAASIVRVSLSESGDAVTLAVEDDGPGVDEADRARIFDRFTRVDDARTQDGGGTGLGLAIVADVVRSHGGRVAVEPAPGTGARFIVTLPTSPDAGPASPGARAREPGSGPDES